MADRQRFGRQPGPDHEAVRLGIARRDAQLEGVGREHRLGQGAAAEQPRRGGGGARHAGTLRAPESPGDTTLAAPVAPAATDTGDLEPVPGGAPGAAGGVDEEHLRYAPRPPRRHPVLRRVAFVLVPLLLLVAVGFAGWTWTRSQYYVAQDGDGVSIFRGVQVDVPGLQLSEVHTRGDFALADLPQFQQEKVVEGIVADDLDDAERILDDLSAEADGGAGGGSSA